MTVTCVSVTSGNASTGRPLNAATPAPMKRITPRTMRSGWNSASPTMRRITSILVGEDLFEQQGAVHHDLVRGLQSLEHQLVAIFERPDLHALTDVAAAARVDEHVVPIAAQVDRARRHEQAS